MNRKTELISHTSSPPARHTEEAAPSFTREEIISSRLRLARVVPYQHSATPLWSNLALAIFSGILLTFAFPEWSLWSLGWVGTAPLIMAIARERRFWRALLLGLVTGTILYAGSSHWVTHSMHYYGGIPLWISFALMLVIALVLGSFTAVFAVSLALGIRRFGGWAILAAPILWAASEWLRHKTTGVGWIALGYSQSFQPAVIQIARWGGVYAVSALLVFASAALVFAVIYLERRRGFIALSISIIVSIAAVSYGLTIRPDGYPARTISIAVIQPNDPIEAAWSDHQVIDQAIEDHINLSLRAMETEKANSNAKKIDLVVWPESPMSLNYERDSATRRALADFTSRNQVYLLFDDWGYAKENDDPSNLYNSAMVIAPSGERISRYDKIALMPFGEYVPARGWIPFMDRVPALVADLAPGTSPTLSDVAGVRLGTLICFEAIRPELARRFRLEGAQVMTQLSNETWFGQTALARQMLAHAVFRAVENDCELIRATNSGQSARIDRYGAIYDETPSFQTTTRVWRVEVASDRLTFYTRYGDVFAWTCAAMGAMMLIASLLPRREEE
ncbi:MAG: apolipoprotein N-acyltransferase [Acidobacteriota bacterium]